MTLSWFTVTHSYPTFPTLILVSVEVEFLFPFSQQNSKWNFSLPDSIFRGVFMLTFMTPSRTNKASDNLWQVALSFVWQHSLHHHFLHKLTTWVSDRATTIEKLKAACHTESFHSNLENNSMCSVWRGEEMDVFISYYFFHIKLTSYLIRPHIANIWHYWVPLSPRIISQ